jgi:hypothetical protein
MTSKKKSRTPYFTIDFPKKWEKLRKSYEAGVDAALYDALELAHESLQVPPDWVFEAALEIIGNQLKNGVSVGKGKTGNTTTKYKYAMKRFRRWHEVKQLHENGMTLEVAFHKAADNLSKTFAKGGYDTMKNSYYKVKKDLIKPKTADLYYSAMHDAQVMTGTAPFVKV